MQPKTLPNPPSFRQLGRDAKSKYVGIRSGLYRDLNERDIESLFGTMVLDALHGKDKDLQYLPFEIYREVQNKPAASMRVYLETKMKESGGKKLNGFSLQDAYKYWLIKFIEATTGYRHGSRTPYPGEVATFLLKEVSGSGDEIETIAYLNVVKRIWKHCKLSREDKSAIGEQLRFYSVSIKDNETAD